MFNTPILFIIFNRLDTTKNVFEQIKKVQPAQLFIAADGPRMLVDGEKEKCETVRNWVMNNLDWDCEVKTLFRDENLGCGKGPASAIDWFFQNVEEGIILEDDIVPDMSFFYFCELQLIKYRNVKNILTISGDNFQGTFNRGDGSYYYSKYVHIWGWATWKRTWDLYDFNIKNWDMFKSKRSQEISMNPIEILYWTEIFDNIYAGKNDAWDYQLFYLSIFNNGLNVIPNINLIKNIGFGEGATHTIDSTHILSKMQSHEYTEDRIPSLIQVNSEADIYTFETVYCNLKPIVIQKKSLIKGIVSKLLGFNVTNNRK
ncbi:MAG TPA: nucleotide-diphospho-sugar transferase [Chitinophagaceae bacterium]|nr:nucleotide-diphospho-sugar transferase [Chitinophagaceae bacterium]